MIRILKKIFNKCTISFSIAMLCVCSLFSITITYASTITNENGVNYEINTPNNEYGKVTINTIGGMSYKYNQLAYDLIETTTSNGITITNNNNGSLSVSGIASANVYTNTTVHTYYLESNHNYFVTGKRFGFYRSNPYSLYFNDNDYGIFSMGSTQSGIYNYQANIRPIDGDLNYTFYPMIIDLTKMGITSTDITIVINEFSIRGIDINSDNEFNSGIIRDSKVTSIIDIDNNSSILETLTFDTNIIMLNGYGIGINNTCYNYIDFSTKKFIRKVERFNLSNLSWNTTSSYKTSNSLSSIIKKPINDDTKANFLTDKYVEVARNYTNNNNDIAIDSNGNIFIRNTTDTPSGYIYIEIESPIEINIEQYITTNEINYIGGTKIKYQNQYNQYIPYNITFIGETISQLYLNYQTLQQDYNTLVQQYNDLQDEYTNYQSTHSYTNIQYNDLVSQITTLETQIGQLMVQYITYMSTHSHTNDEYDILSNQYQTLSYNYTTLQNNYNVLQQQYNDLLSSFNELSRLYQCGYWYFVDYFHLDIVYSDGNVLFDFDLNDMITNNYINGFVFDVNSFISDNIDVNRTYLYYGLTCFFKDSSVSINYLDLVFSDLVFSSSDVISAEVTNIDLEQPTQIISISFYDTTKSLNAYNIVCSAYGYRLSESEFERIKYNTNNFNTNFINKFGIYSSSYNYNITSSSAVGGDSFQFGYGKGYSDCTLAMNDIAKENSLLKYQYQSLLDDYALLGANYNSLQTSYQNALSGNNFTSLFFTIAETPFSSFKQIWNVDFLGVNLSGFVTGLLFIGLMIWLVKKIF